MPHNPRARFLAYVEQVDNGCWIWKGHLDAKGYGAFGIGTKVLRAHRWSFQNIRGETLISGLELDHLCRNRACVNPWHLEQVDHQTNMSRGFHATKTHCIRGHEFNEENTYVDPRGRRNCRRCKPFHKQTPPENEEIRVLN